MYGFVGGGFTGLWTAYELSRAAPRLDLVVLGANYAEFGASGRNGGLGRREDGRSTAALARTERRGGSRGDDVAIRDTVGEIGDVVAREQIDCDFHAAGRSQSRHPRPSSYDSTRA